MGCPVDCAFISLLIGMIFAFVGVMQLKNFGAGIYTCTVYVNGQPSTQRLSVR